VRDLEKRPLQVESDVDDQPLPALIQRLGSDLVTLLESKIALLKIEVKEEIVAHVRVSLAAGVGAAAALVGAVLLNVALAFFLASLFSETRYVPALRYAVGFLLVGGPYLAGGVLVVGRSRRRFASTNTRVIPEGAETAMRDQ
jgi:uncharacterized membrane protein YqjE